jgi:calnexin
MRICLLIEVYGMLKKVRNVRSFAFTFNVGEQELIKGDKGLVLKTLAAHSAIAAKFDKPIDPKGKGIVVQYEAKFQNGLECGGAYMKLLTHDPDFDAAKLADKTPYTIMFG